MAKKTKRPKDRPRGGASVPCPSCGSASHVLKTARDDKSVVRRRECLDCGAVFQTTETVT